MQNNMNDIVKLQDLLQDLQHKFDDYCKVYSHVFDTSLNETAAKKPEEISIRLGR